MDQIASAITSKLNELLKPNSLKCGGIRNQFIHKSEDQQFYSFFHCENQKGFLLLKIVTIKKQKNRTISTKIRDVIFQPYCKKQKFEQINSIIINCQQHPNCQEHLLVELIIKKYKTQQRIMISTYIDIDDLNDDSRKQIQFCQLLLLKGTFKKIKFYKELYDCFAGITTNNQFLIYRIDINQMNPIQKINLNDLFSDEIIDFNFLENKELCNKYTVHFLKQNGSIVSLFPFLPDKSILHKEDIEYLRNSNIDIHIECQDIDINGQETFTIKNHSHIGYQRIEMIVPQKRKQTKKQIKLYQNYLFHVDKTSQKSEFIYLIKTGVLKQARNQLPFLQISMIFLRRAQKIENSSIKKYQYLQKQMILFKGQIQKTLEDNIISLPFQKIYDNQFYYMYKNRLMQFDFHELSSNIEQINDRFHYITDLNIKQVVSLIVENNIIQVIRKGQKCYKFQFIQLDTLQLRVNIDSLFQKIEKMMNLNQSFSQQQIKMKKFELENLNDISQQQLEKYQKQIKQFTSSIHKAIDVSRGSLEAQYYKLIEAKNKFKRQNQKKQRLRELLQKSKQKSQKIEKLLSQKKKKQQQNCQDIQQLNNWIKYVQQTVIDLSENVKKQKVFQIKQLQVFSQELEKRLRSYQNILSK